VDGAGITQHRSANVDNGPGHPRHPTTDIDKTSGGIRGIRERRRVQPARPAAI